MARRYRGRMNGERFLANASPSKREVHDLDNETRQCQIDEIIAARNERPYERLSDGKRDGYDNCQYCIGNSTR